MRVFPTRPSLSYLCPAIVVARMVVVIVVMFVVYVKSHKREELKEMQCVIQLEFLFVNEFLDDF